MRCRRGACLDSESFDCVLIDVPGCPDRDKATTLHEMRKLVMSSSVVLITASTIESLVEKALAEGSITLVPDNEIEKVLPQRFGSTGVLLQSRCSIRKLLERLTQAGLRAAAADTLPSTLNMLADGWCDAVLLDVEIPGLTATDKAALFGPFAPQHLAILASGDYGKPSGIPCVQRPHQPEELLSILEQIVKRRPAPCGWVESSGGGSDRDVSPTNPQPKLDRSGWGRPCGPRSSSYFPRDFRMSSRLVRRSGLRLCTDMILSGCRFSRSILARKTCVPTTGGLGTGAAAVGRLNMSA